MLIQAVFLLGIFSSSLGDFVIHYPTEFSNGTTYYSISYGTRFPFLNSNLTGQIVFEQVDNYYGKIVLADIIHPTLVEKMAVEAQYAGAIGLIMLEPNYPPGYYEFATSQIPIRNISIPVFEIGADSFEALKSARNISGGLVVTMIPRQSRYAEVVSDPGMIAWMVINSAFCVANIILAIIKIVQYSNVGKLLPNVAILCLFTEIIVNSVRFPVQLLDPVFVTGILPTLVLHVLITGHIPFMIVSTLMFLMYWQELMFTTSLRVKTFITALRIPFIIITLVVFLLEWVTTILRSVFYIEILISATIVVYLVVFLFIGIYTIVMGAKLIQNPKAKTVPAIRQVSIRVLLAGISYILVVGCQMFIGTSTLRTSGFQTYPFNVNKALWFFTFFFSNAISSLQIQNFQTKNKAGVRPLSTFSTRSSASLAANDSAIEN